MITAWIEVTDDDEVLFIPPADEIDDLNKPYEQLADYGGISYAEEWMEAHGWEPLGDWVTGRRLDGTWETRLLVGAA